MKNNLQVTWSSLHLWQGPGKDARFLKWNILSKTNKSELHLIDWLWKKISLSRNFRRVGPLERTRSSSHFNSIHILRIQIICKFQEGSMFQHVIIVQHQYRSFMWNSCDIIHLFNVHKLDSSFHKERFIQLQREHYFKAKWLTSVSYIFNPLHALDLV